MTVFNVQGRPLADLGLERGVLVLSDGTTMPFEGLVASPGATVLESVLANAPDGAVLMIPSPTYPDRENS